MTIDPFTTAARAEAQRAYQDTGMPRYDLAVHMAEWARDHIAAQEPTDAEVEKERDQVQVKLAKTTEQLHDALDVEVKLIKERDEALAEVNELWPFRKRAEKAEQERDHFQEVANTFRGKFNEADERAEKAERAVEDMRAEMRACDVHNGIVLPEPRPFTPDDITDEMVERALDAADQYEAVVINKAIIREALTAALTEPPARPEGAEEIEALVDTWKLHAEPRPTLPDFLAEHGVRVVTEEDHR